MNNCPQMVVKQKCPYLQNRMGITTGNIRNVQDEQFFG
jgi:hypothetical protein